MRTGRLPRANSGSASDWRALSQTFGLLKRRSQLHACQIHVGVGAIRLGDKSRPRQSCSQDKDLLLRN